MRINIIGIGLLGGSFAMGLRKTRPEFEFIGVEANHIHAQKAVDLGIVDKVLPLDEALAVADLSVLATPVNIIERLLPEVLDKLPAHGKVIDLGSTKQIICDKVRKHPKRSQFVAAHPMAGTENSGPDAAFATLMKGKTVVICEKESSDPQAVYLVESLFRELGMVIDYMNAVDHDLHLAYVSHLSHITSFALGLTVLGKEKDEKRIFELASTGFSSTVRLAKSSPAMWAPIFAQNKANVCQALDGYIESLQIFKDAIQHSEEHSYQLMEKANDIRRILSGIEKKSVNS
ncbi:prephenate dehydrogenase [Rapidithrix thailandica]|uniref:Prephenate dehydrogenase n=1 Tax=Rapidithrix thailandica TaxID=413964 RepID=A0AAW9S5B5_9BACT